jgi:hypothetical protein
VVRVRAAVSLQRGANPRAHIPEPPPELRRLQRPSAIIPGP